MRYRLFILLTIFFCGAHAQQTDTLKNTILRLEKQYGVRFSYDENLVQSVKKISLSEDGLQHELEQLYFKTGLIFEALEKDYYVVRKPSKNTTTIKGRLLDDLNDQPLSQVIVQQGEQGVFSTTDGTFQLKNVLKDGFVTLSYLGYETQKIKVASFAKNNFTIRLKQNLEQLSEVVVSSYLGDGISKNTNGKVVMKPNKTGVLPGLIEPDVLQTLQLLPGVQSPDETASGLHIRGSTPDQNLVIFDGIKLYHSAHYFGLISAFNPYVTEQVELYRSGTEAQYGNNVGGVLNIATNKNIPVKNSFGLGINLTHVDAFAKLKSKNNKLGLILSARRSTTDLYNTVTNDNFAEAAFQNSRIEDVLDADNNRVTAVNNDYFFADYTAKMIFKPNEKHQFTVSNLYNINDLTFQTSTVRFPIKFKDDLKIENKGFHADWTWIWNNNWKQYLAVNQSIYQLRYDGVKDLGANNDTSSADFFDKENTVEDINVEYKVNYKNHLEFGLQHFKNKVNYTFNRAGVNQDNTTPDLMDQKGSNSALYAQYKKRWLKKWLVNIGLRYQSFNDLNQQYLEPRLFVNYKHNSNIRFKFSSEIKHQSISQIVEFREDGLGTLSNEFWALSNNRRIPVLESFQNTIGVVFSKNKWAVDIDAYQKNIDGIKYLIEGNNYGLANPQNNNDRNGIQQGTNRVFGVDVLVKKQWQNHSSWFGYTFSKSKYQFNNLNEGKSFDGDNDSPHSLVWSHHYKTNNGFEFSLGWRWRNGVPYTQKFAQSRVVNSNRIRLTFDEVNGKRLPNYQRVDTSAMYRFKLGKSEKINAKIGLSLLNIFDKQNILSRNYEIERSVQGQGMNTTITENLAIIDRMSLGFTPNAVFRLDF